MTGQPPLAPGNARVKGARKLGRRPVRTARRQFLADGPKAVEAALATPGCSVEVFAAPAAAGTFPGLRAAAEAAGVPWTPVAERSLAALSDSVTPAGVVAVCRFVDRPLHEVVANARLLVVCADVRDPGNAGTVIRTADAVAADGVVLAGHSADLYNPKTVRASVGSLFHLPLATSPEPTAALTAARDAGLTVLAADGEGETDLYDADELLRRPLAWLFGNEARGLPAELVAAADHRVRIPIHGRAESLNLAAAAAVCLYATARVRR